MEKIREAFTGAVKAVTRFALNIAEAAARTIAKGTEEVGSLAAGKVSEEVKAHKKEVSKGVMIGAGVIAVLAAAVYLLSDEESEK